MFFFLCIYWVLLCAQSKSESALGAFPQPVTGDDSSESSRYGGHVMCVPGSKCQIAGVLGYRMGQENFMGRHGVI